MQNKSEFPSLRFHDLGNIDSVHKVKKKFDTVINKHVVLFND